MKALPSLGSSLAARFPAFRERARVAASTGRVGLDFGLGKLNHALGVPEAWASWAVLLVRARQRYFNS